MVKRFSSGRPKGRYDLALEMSMLSASMRQAFFTALDSYEATGVRFALCGGLAVGSYSEPRVTRDIDFLVGDEAFDQVGLLVIPKFKFPRSSSGFEIDTIPLPAENKNWWNVLNDELEHAEIDTSLGRPVPVMTARGLAYMKLLVGRAKDLGDVVALIESGAVQLEEIEQLIDGDVELERRLLIVEQESQRQS